MKISVILPTYCERDNIADLIRAIDRSLDQQDWLVEIVVVDDGSQDRTYEIAQEFAAEHPGFTVIHEQGRGKGLAVRCGMLAAQGEYRFMCDADLSMPVTEINLFIPPEFQNCSAYSPARGQSAASRRD